jgi:pyruvate dehydrogenase E2 component (dihydrolipoamide acetyltransferase)
MAHALIMPRQGNTVESCIIVRWKVAEGDSVKADEVACEVETDKASFDVPAGAAGLVLKILHPEGDDVPVLEAIAVIGQAGEDWKSAVGGNPGSAAERGAAPPAAESVAANASLGHAPNAQATTVAANALAGGGTAVSPRARKLAAAEGIDPAALSGTGPGGRVIEPDVVSALTGRPALTAAAKAAVSAGAASPGSGPGLSLGGRIGIGDLAKGTAFGGAERHALGEAVPAAVPREFPGPYTDAPLKGVRKIISERMLGSLASTAQLTFNGSANAERILSLRARFKASSGGAAAEGLGLSEVTIGDLVLYAVSRVLPRFPNANATLSNGNLRSFERVHLALAVDTPRGLMVPVIRDADLLSLREISREAKRLAAACVGGSVSPDELSGGTFTVSNLGAFGIESFTPVLNAPQVAILGVDAIVPRAAAGPGGSVVLEQRLGLSLTVDHQIVDGAPAARLLKAFADAIADIDLLLMERA